MQARWQSIILPVMVLLIGAWIQPARAVLGLAAVVQAGDEWTGQFSDPLTSAEHPVLRVHFNGTLHNLQSYEPVGIEPNLDELGPIEGGLVHHVNSTGGPDLACTSAAGRNYTGMMVLVQRGECHFVDKIRNIQVSGAVAVIVYDNIDEGWVHMGWDETVQPEIPSVFIQKREADMLLHYMSMKNESGFADGIDATLLPDNENSIRFRLLETTPGAPGVVYVAGEIDMRRTVDGHMGTDYMKYSVNGSLNELTGELVLSPLKWITQPSLYEFSWMGLQGNMLAERHALRGRLSPYNSIVHMRTSNKGGCPARVSMVEHCQTTGENSYCGQGCLEVTDENGYRVFNDESCEFTEPLMWYCNVNTQASESSVQDDDSFSCEGERLLLRPPLVQQANVCPAGSKQQYPFFSEWPVKHPGQVVQAYDWDAMTPNSQHGSFVTYFCRDLECSAENRVFGKGWRMRGGYADSGNSQAPNSKSVLEYRLPMVNAGAEVLFTYISNGEVNFDYLQFAVCQGERCTEFTKYKAHASTTWRREKYILPMAGEYTLKWTYVKDASQDYGTDEARLLEVAITGFSDDSACTPCPADHCSMGRIDGCQACPSGTTSGVGASTCTLCDAPLPPNAHFSVGAEFEVTDCAISCDPGYQQSGFGADMKCFPRPDVCLLPYKSSYSGKFDSPSFGMLKQCLQLRHPIKDYCQDAIATLENIIRSEQMDVWSDKRAGFYSAIKEMLTAMKANAQCSDVFASDYDFHQKILDLLKEDRDSTYIYAPPDFYQNLYLYLPVRFNYTSDGDSKKIYVANPSEMSRMYGYAGQNTSSVDMDSASQLLGWQVISVDGVDAQEAFTAFADSQVGFSTDDATRFDLAVRGDMPSLWTCSLGVRNLAKCGMPPTPSMQLKLQNPNDDDETRTVDVLWTILYLGQDCGTKSPLDESTEEAGSCSYHEPADALNCDLYNLARSAEQGHWAFSDDDFGMEDVAVSLHHSYFPHKELMETAALSTAQHTTHFWKDMTLTVLDSYPHIAAYAHTEGNGVKTGIMRIASFHGEAAEVHAVMMELTALQPNRIVIDLRTNGGGHTCHAMQLAYLVSGLFGDSSDPKKSAMMEMFASNQSFFASAHPEFALAPANFLKTGTYEPYAEMDWYSESSTVEDLESFQNYTQMVSMNCQRYSSLLDYWEKDKKMFTRKTLNFEKKRIQVLVDSQCVGACALFARMASAQNFATVIGVGINEVGTAPSGISADIDGLVCQQKGMKLDEDNIPPSQLLRQMPAKGQNLVIPMTRSCLNWDQCESTKMAPDIVLSSNVPRPDFAEGFWYSGMELYCASIDHFDGSTGKYGPNCSNCDDGGGCGAGWIFFYMLLGVLMVPLIGGIAYYFQQNGCSGDSWLGLFGAVAGCCVSCINGMREFGHRMCGSRWERSYGSLSGDASDGMPSSGRCRDCDWRSWIPGMKGSALEDQYSDMNAGDELNSLPTNTSIPAPMNIVAESHMDSFDPEANAVSSDKAQSDMM